MCIFPGLEMSASRIHGCTAVLCTLLAEPVQTQEGEEARSRGKAKKRFASSWDAKAAGAAEGTKADYLSNLGQAQEYNINVTHGGFLSTQPADPCCTLNISSLLISWTFRL